MLGRLDCILVVISGSLVAACGGLARPEPPSARETECLLTPPSRATTDGSPARAAAAERAPIDVAIDQPVDVERAPRPANAVEQMVFAQVYETLVRVDCTGSVIPGLAESWRRADEEGGWLFTLRPGARFHDGSPVAARVVGESLVGTSAPPARRESAQRRAAAARIASMTVLNDNVLRVELVDAAGGADARGPAAFASPELAVGKIAPSGLPLGSGAYEIGDATVAERTSGGTVELQPMPPLSGAQRRAAFGGAARLPLAFRLTSDGDPRNAIDVGVDVLVTADPDAIDYALARGSYVTAPLPWDAAYVLFAPVGAGAAAARARVPAAALDDLARDAVPGVARASSLEAPWTCAAVSARQPRPRPRIAFRRGDHAAAGLAERLVALARTDSADWIRDVLPAARASTLAAAPLSADELAASLRRGRDAAYVIAVDSKDVAPCPQPSRRVSLRAVPLVDTRRTAILRRGLEGVIVDADGTLRFAGAWRRAESEVRR